MALLDELVAIAGDTLDNRVNLQMLVQQLQSRVGVLPFIGSGIAIPFGFPSWKDFLLHEANKVGVEGPVGEMLERGQFEEAAEHVFEKRGRLSFHDAITITYSAAPVSRGGTVAADYLPELFPGPVITTNYDHVLEEVFDHAGSKFVEIVSGADADRFTTALNLDKRFLLKIHGDSNSKTNRILAQHDYEQYYGTSGGDPFDFSLPLPRLLRRMMLARSLLFIGCGLNQDRTMAVLKRVADDEDDITHFAVCECPSTKESLLERARFLSERNIRHIWYPPGQHDRLGMLMQRLSHREIVELHPPAPQFIPIPLNETKLANYDLSIYSSPPFGPTVYKSVQFEMRNARISMDHHPTKILSLLKPVAMVSKIHVLINVGDARRSYGQIKIGEVRLHHSGDATDSFAKSLILGSNVREWAIGNYVRMSATDPSPDALIDSTTDPSTVEIWRGTTQHGQVAVIDMLTIEVPEPKRHNALRAIEFTFESLLPGVGLDYFISGLTLETER